MTIFCTNSITINAEDGPTSDLFIKLNSACNLELPTILVIPMKSLILYSSIMIFLFVGLPGWTKTIYVNHSATGENNGSNWADAYVDLQDALAAAEAEDEIWVARGRYIPGTTRDSTFQLKEGVALYGGFNGSEINREDRNWTMINTILSGDINGDDGLHFFHYDENVYHVVTGANEGIIDGFTITGGNADGGFPIDNHGGGMINPNSSPTISNCTFIRNRATSRGGGMNNDMSSSTIDIDPLPTIKNCSFIDNSASFGGAIGLSSSPPAIINCTFRNNTANQDGGGIYFSGWAAKPMLTDCIFYSNAAGLKGGAVHSSSSSPSLSRCQFISNKANHGGGLFSAAGDIELLNCILSNNSAIKDGGGLSTYRTNLVVRHCTFYGNDGGGIVDTSPLFAPPNIIVKNSILWDNEIEGSPAAIRVGNDFRTEVTYSCVQEGFDGAGNIDQNPLFLNAEDGFLYLAPGSPCLDTGTSSEAPDIDLIGITRPQGDGVDMGAYEITTDPILVIADVTESEGAGAADVPVTLSWPNGAEVRVDYATGNGTAKSGLDYIDNSGTLTWDAGADGIRSIRIIFNDDSEIGHEGNETLAINLFNSVNASLLKPKGILTIISHDTIYVKSDATGNESGTSWENAYTNLQDALNIADLGDEIWVAAGRYVPGSSRDSTFQLPEGVSLYGGFKGHEFDRSQRNWHENLTLLSGDLNRDDIGFVNNNENSLHVVTGADKTILDGFIISSGNAGFSSGGGIYSNKSTMRITNCTLTLNQANYGGGIYADSSSLTIDHCVFTKNSAGHGGGIYTRESPSTLTNCTLTNNNSASYGGGIYINNSSSTLTGCAVANNSSAINGGGIYNHYSNVTFTACKVIGNIAVSGGGIFNATTTISIYDSLIIENSTFKNGGGIYNSFTDSTIVNCTFYNNTATLNGGMMYDFQSSASIKNSILWADLIAGKIAEIPETDNLPNLLDGDSSELTVTYSCIQGGYEGTGNIDQDPLFIEAGSGIFYLAPESPCLDSGTSEKAHPEDILGTLRPQLNGIDMGAFEATGLPVAFAFNVESAEEMGTATLPITLSWPGDDTVDIGYIIEQKTAIAGIDYHASNGTLSWNATEDGQRNIHVTIINDSELGNENSETFRVHLSALPNVTILNPTITVTILSHDIIYVRANAEGLNDGSSWTHAYVDLQDALAASDTGDEIWVAAGTYVPGDVRDVTFQLKERVAVYGGFSGAEQTLDERDWMSNTTTLSGDVLGNDGLDFEGYEDNVYHVIAGANHAILDGFLIMSGNPPHFPSGIAKGGMINVFSSPIVVNCTFTRHSGDGIANRYSSPLIEDSVFEDNGGFGVSNDSASPRIRRSTLRRNGAGGLYNQSSSPLIEDCVFEQNQNSGMVNNESSPTVTNCIFHSNLAQFGAGMNNSSSSPTLTRCFFADNIAGWSGGGMYNTKTSLPRLTNCRFVGNSADSDGGGIYSSGSSSPLLIDCEFRLNTADDSGGGLYNFASSPVMSNCIFSQNNAGKTGGGMYSTNSSLSVITNCSFLDNSAGAGGGMYNNYGSSPSISNTTFRGNSTIWETGSGGGLVNSNQSSPSVTNCWFSGNRANNDGGGMLNHSDSSPTIVNSVFNGNFVDSNGGAMFNGSSTPTIINCTFAGNGALEEGGGMTNTNSSPTVTNTLFWGNIDNNGSTFSAQINDDNSTSTITYSLIQDYPSPGTDGNLKEDPLLIDADGPDNQFGTEDDNLQVLPDSPVVDNGYNQALPKDAMDLDGDDDMEELIPLDLGRRPRLIGGVVDIGAYETPEQSVVISADQVATGASNDGTPDYFHVQMDDGGNVVTISVDITGAGGTSGVSVFSAPVLDIALLTIIGSEDDDTLMIEFTNSPVSFFVSFLGGSGSNNLSIIGTAGDDSFHLAGHAIYNDTNTISFDDVNGLIIESLDGNDNTTISASFHPPEVVTFNGGDGSDALTGGQSTGFWEVTGINRGHLNWLEFVNVENLVGASGDDSFHFHSGSVLDGAIDGQTGTDTLDYTGFGITDIAIFSSDKDGFSGSEINSLGKGFKGIDFFEGVTPAISINNQVTSEGDDAVIQVSLDFPIARIVTVDYQSEDMEATASKDYVAASGKLRFIPGELEKIVRIATATDLAVEDDEKFRLNLIDPVSAVVINPTITITIRDSVPPIFVDQDSLGANDGSSWVDAFSNLQDALGVAAVGDEIWVAKGTYIPGEFNGDRNATFQLKSGVKLFGGFTGTEIARFERDPVTNVTTLSGDLNGDDSGFTNNSENCHHVVTGSNTDAFTVLDGFTISGGNADRIAPNNRGGGMIIIDGSPTISNCKFNENSASTEGGGLYNSGSSPLLTSCTFNKNKADHYGGGICNRYLSSPIITDCSFVNNTTDLTSGAFGSSGGAIYNRESEPTIMTSMFEGNASGEGGGIHNTFSSPTVVNCLFKNNIARSLGGGIHNDKGTPTLSNCIFDGNSAEFNGGGVANSSSSPKVDDCIFTDNFGGGMSNKDSSPTITRCIFTNNSGGSSGGGMRNLSSSPRLSDCMFTNNVANFGGGMYNATSSPIMINCEFRNNQASNRGGGIYEDESSSTLSRCMIIDNSSASGAGIMIVDGSSSLVNCRLTHNTAAELGGGVFSSSSSSAITNCVINGNTAAIQGGGIYHVSSTSTLTNCTIAGNSAAYGGGILTIDDSFPTITNSIIWNNVDTDNPQLTIQIRDDETSSSVVTFSLIQDWATPDVDGNLNDLPLFIDADGQDNIPGTDDDNLKLQNNSPAVNAGDLKALPSDLTDLDDDNDMTEIIPLDLDLRPRIISGEVDMGAFETPELIIVLNANSANTGSADDGIDDLFTLSRDTSGYYLIVQADTSGSSNATSNIIFKKPLFEVYSLTINGSNDDDTLVIDHSNGHTTIPITFNGDGGSNEFAFNATSGDDTVTIGEGSILTNNTTFAFNDVSTLTVNLQAGNDILNLLSKLTSTENVIVFGGDDSDSLVGPDSSTLWTITVANSGSIGHLSFFDFENLTGGIADDVFEFSANSEIDGGIEGGPGVDTLDVAQLATTTITVNGSNAEGYYGTEPTSIADGFSGIDLISGAGFPTVTVEDTTVTEGSTANFAITLSIPISDPVTISYRTADGDAAASVDYQQDSGELTFFPGQLKRTIPIATFKDTIFELNEDFTLHLDNSTNAVIKDSMGSAIIHDSVPPIFVNAHAIGADDGSSWKDAFTDLQTALSAAVEGDEIWVAAGTYKPRFLPGPIIPGSRREASFKLRNRVRLIGGFAGTEHLKLQRNHTVKVTILSGDLDGDDDGFINNSENCYHVVRASCVDSTAVIDGFTITGGNAEQTGFTFNDDSGFGGGIRIESSSPTVMNCNFTGNMAGGGAGMYNDNAAPRVIDCQFANNSATNSVSFSFGGLGGGGMYNRGSSPSITKCIFRNNITTGPGGGIYYGPSASATNGLGYSPFCGLETNTDFSASPTITDCSFDGNSAGNGGGIYISNSSLIITRCNFNENTATDSGGGLFDNSGTTTVINSRFNGNRAAHGGGMRTNSSNLRMINCIVAGNTANASGGGMSLFSSAPIIANCTFAGNSATETGGGVDNIIGSGPKFTNCIFWDNFAGDATTVTAQIHDDETSSSIVSYCLVEGWLPPAADGNLSANPMFIDADGPDNDFGTIDDNFELLPGSPALNAGNNNALFSDITDLDNDGDTTEVTPIDLSSRLRILNDKIDLGAFESPEHPVEISANDAHMGAANDGIEDHFEVKLDGNGAILVVRADVTDETTAEGPVIFNAAPLALSFITIVGSDDNDTLIINHLNGIIPIPISFNAGGGENHLTIVGTPGSDTFTLVDNVVLSGPVSTAFDHIDSLTINSKQGADMVVVHSNFDVKGMTTFNGGHGSDTLVGPNVSQTWNIIDMNDGDLLGLDFFDVESLIGGLEDDTFMFHADSSLHGVINGQAGTDTLNYVEFGTTNLMVTASDDNGYLGIEAHSLGDGFRGIDVFAGIGNPSISITDVTVSEGATAEFVVSLSFPIAQEIAIDYKTSDGEAESVSDYTAVAGSLIFHGGETTKTIRVGTLKDAVTEPTETYTIQLVGQTHVTIVDAVGLGNITDAPPIFVNLNAIGNNDGSSWANAFNHLQDALAVAAASDEVWIAAGTYTPSTKNIDREATFQLINGVRLFGGFAGNEILLTQRQVNDNVTILSGDLRGDDTDFSNNWENSYAVVTCSDADETTVLDGFTITAANDNSYFEWGSGIYIYSASPVISNCVVKNNFADDGGGGIFINSGSPTVIHCTFVGNSTERDGGGIKDGGSSTKIIDCVFFDNMAERNGGGISGGVNGESTIRNCVFSGNHAKKDGGGISIGSARITITHCTFSDNVADGRGGGMFSSGATSSILTNCIFWANQAGSFGDEVYSSTFLDPKNSFLLSGSTESKPLFTFCNIRNSGGSQDWDPNLGFDGGHNIDMDPMFVDIAEPSGSDGVLGTLDDGLRLRQGSPCINSGSLSESNDEDIVGLARPQADFVDMGAYEYEFSENAVYSISGTVDYSGTQTGSMVIQVFNSPHLTGIPVGSVQLPTSNRVFQISNLFTGTYYLLAFMDINENGQFDLTEPQGFYNGPIVLTAHETVSNLQLTDTRYIVYVDSTAQGNNDGSSWTHAFQSLNHALGKAIVGQELWVAKGTYTPSMSTDRSRSFRLKPGVDVYGGFAGTESSRSDRDWLTYVTILSGDIGKPNDMSDNSYHVVIGTDNAVLDGFIISHGNAKGDDQNRFGGGMYNWSSSPIISNCMFKHNWAISGGGIYNIHDSSPTVTDCRFSDNRVDFNGGGIMNRGGSPKLIRCRFHKNSAESNGGGIVNIDSSPTINNCLFSGNSARTFGGAIANRLSTPLISNCTLNGNSASAGGAIYNNSSSPIIKNSILWENVGTRAGPELHSEDISSGFDLDREYESNPDITYSCIQGGYPGHGNTDLNPLFVDAEKEIFYLQPGSPCIDTGTLDASPTDDITGTLRPLGNEMDMGVYEINGQPVLFVSDITAAEGDHTVSIPVTLAWAEDQEVQVNYRTTPGTAQNGIDYHSNPTGVLSWSTETGRERTIPISLLSDQEPELLEMIRIVLSDSTNAIIIEPNATLTILSRDTIYVKADADGKENGTSWADAYRDLQDALEAADVSDEIWVAAGEYIPGVSRLSTFRLKSGVALYGGFDGSESEREHRDWISNITILSGDVNGDDQPGFKNNDENVYHVVTGEDNGILDGFQISAGNSDGQAIINRSNVPRITIVSSGIVSEPKFDVSGGGMININASPTINNCNFVTNCASTGGGMYNSNAFVTITNCTFSHNFSGGMYNWSSSPAITSSLFRGNNGSGIENVNSDSPFSDTTMTIMNCTFSYNTKKGISNKNSSPTIVNSMFNGNSDRGIYNDRSSPTLAGCVFIGNTTRSFGGGIYNENSSGKVSKCSFIGNSSESRGGGIYNVSSSPSFTDCVFKNNNAENGGGIFNWSSSPRITNCISSENSASNDGGGMLNRDSSPKVINCIFNGNSSSGHGGGIYNKDASPTISNCTLTDNIGNSGGGIYNEDSSPIIANSIVWENMAKESGPELKNEGISNTNIVYSCIKGGFSGAGNISVDPLFLDPGKGIFYLNSTSPCIDAGLAGGAPSSDAVGTFRPQGNGVDMGAYEFTGLPLIYMDDLEVIEGEGIAQFPIFLYGNQDHDIRVDFSTDDGTALKDLDYTASSGSLLWDTNQQHQQMIEVTINNDNLQINEDREFITLTLSNATNAAILTPLVIVHVLSHDIIYVNDDASSGNNNGYSWRDAYRSLHDALSAADVEDEIWVAAGTYLLGASHNSGYDNRGETYRLKERVALYGGFVGTEIDRDQRDWTLHASILSGDINQDDQFGVINYDDNVRNVVTAMHDGILDGFIIIGGNGENGAGIQIIDSSPIIKNCMLVRNIAAEDGGAIYSSNSSAIIMNCIFHGNRAESGGAMYNESSSLELTDCRFTGNTASDEGGAMVNDASSPMLANCIFSGNQSSSGGGMYNTSAASPILIYCNFTENIAGWRGGGIYNLGSSPTITHSIYHGNTARIGAGIFNFAASPMVVDCALIRNTASEDGGGMNSRGDSFPIITNCTFGANSAQRGGGMYNSESSPVVKNSIFWGDSATDSGPEFFNSDGVTPIVSYSCVQNGYIGEGNIDKNPLLTLDGHLEWASPCINSGTIDDRLDLDRDREERPFGATTDMGVDEFVDSDGDQLPDWLEQQVNGDNNSLIAEMDLDNDGLTNLDEYRNSTNPLNPDTDFDGAWDGEEVIFNSEIDGFVLRSDPLHADSILAPYNHLLASDIGEEDDVQPVFHSTPADIDGDRDIDLLITTATGQIVTYENRGSVVNPLWNGPTIDPFGIDVGPGQRVFFADIANAAGETIKDGFNDLIVVDREKKMTRFINHQHEKELSWGLPDSDWAGSTEFTESISAQVDIDLDGDLDRFAGLDGDNVPIFVTNTTEHLLIFPRYLTVVQGESHQFEIKAIQSTAVFSITERFNSSNATITEEGFYTAGTDGTGVDVIQATTGGLSGLAVVNVISKEDADRKAKVLIIVGTRSTEDSLFPTSERLAMDAYVVCRQRGYRASDICLLTPSGTLSQSTYLGYPITAAGDNGQLETAIKDWASDVDDLILYFVDHGVVREGKGNLVLRPGTYLDSETLKAWLDDWQTQRAERTSLFIIDTCYSGHFVEELAFGSPQRIVMAASKPGALAHFQGNGSISFSQLFWDEIAAGTETHEAFLTTVKNLADTLDQVPLIDTNGDGTAEEIDEIETVRGIGLADLLGGIQRPAVGTVMEDVAIDERSATLWCSSVVSNNGIQKVIAYIVPPTLQTEVEGGSALTDMANVELVDHIARRRISKSDFESWQDLPEEPDKEEPENPFLRGEDKKLLRTSYTQNRSVYELNERVSASDLLRLRTIEERLEYSPRYEADWENFDTPGTYRILFFAEDNWGMLSTVRSARVTVEGPRKKAIIIECHGITDVGAPWPSDEIGKQAQLVRQTLHNRSFAAEDIQWFGPAHQAVNKATIADVLTSDFVEDIDELTLYWVGNATTEGVLLTDDDRVTPLELKGWLDTLQGNSTCRVTVVVETDYSGRFLAGVANPDYERYVVTSTDSVNQTLRSSGLAFGNWFWGEIRRGRSIQQAFIRSKAIARASQIQPIPFSLDDDGNGTYERKKDGLRTSNKFIGTLFLTGDDEVQIGSVSESLVLEPGDSGFLFVKDAFSPDGAELRVIATLIQVATGEIMTADALIMANAGSGHYQRDIHYDDFPEPGHYVAIIQAASINDSTLSAIPVPVDIFVGVMPPTSSGAIEDTYPRLVVDDDATAAELDDSGQDIYRLWAVVSQAITIELEDVSEGADVRLAILAGPQKTDTPLEEADDSPAGIGEFIFSWNPPDTGWYYVQVEAITVNEVPASYSIGVTSEHFGADGFEEDDIPEMAKWISWQDGEFQEHNFHDEGDEDWVFFFARKDTSYQINVFREGVNCDVVLELYEEVDGDFSLLQNVDQTQGNDETITYQRGDTAGRYYIRIRHANPLVHNVGTEYRIRVIDETGGIPGILMVLIHDNFLNEQLLAGNVSAAGLDPFRETENVYVLDSVPAGTYDVTVRVNGYQPNPASQSVDVRENDFTEAHFNLTPISLSDRTVSLKKGWNMTSLPFIPRDNRVETVFQDRALSSEVWSWKDGRFQPAQKLLPKTGYWVYCHDQEEPLSLQGMDVIDTAKTLNKGWNLFGAASNTPLPEAIDGPVWYWENGIFKKAQTLKAGHGYWIYTDEPITIEFNSNPETN